GDAIVVSSLDPGFSGALLKYENGSLTGTLTTGPDTAVVSLNQPSLDDGVVLDVTVNGFTQTFGAEGGGVKSVDLDGLAGADTFTVGQVLPIPISVTGGPGGDTLAGPTGGMSWDVTGPDAGSADGIASFSQVENLRGGSGADRFNVRDGGSISGQ